jgi:WD40 repeat protein
LRKTASRFNNFLTGPKGGSAPGTLSFPVFDAATGAVITELRGHEGQVESIAFSPDGRHVVTASLDSTARIWDAAVGRQIAVLKGHEAAVGGASFSPDGRRIMTEASDSTIRIWDAATAGQVAVLEAESGVALAFGPNAKSVVKMGLLDRGTHPIRVWRVFSNTHDLVDDTKNVVPRCLTREQREGAFLDPTPPAWCIEMKKWPYQTQEWKDWLRYTRTNDSPPLPDTPTWSSWVAAREAK